MAPHAAFDFPTILTLPYDADLLAMCNAGREAALGFLNNAMTTPWGRDELEEWLRGPYALATEYARVIGEAGAGAGGSSEASVLVENNDDTLRAIWSAHRDCIEFLIGLPEPTGTGGFVVSSVRAGLVVRAEDKKGATCWVPRCAPGQTLSDRVQSLLAADFLTRGEDYGALLSICSRCSRVEFDALSRVRGMCLEETPSSVLRTRRDTEISALAQYR